MTSVLWRASEFSCVCVWLALPAAGVLAAVLSAARVRGLRLVKFVKSPAELTTAAGTQDDDQVLDQTPNNGW